MVNFMKKLNFNCKILLVLTFIGFASTVINVINYENYFEVTVNKFSNTGKFKTSNWVLNSSICIDETSEWGCPNWSKAATDNPWCSGSGTWNNPYIIENVTITNGNYILIRKSQVPFIIRNCIVYNSSIWSPYAGIFLFNTDNGQVIDNDFSNGNRHGIGLTHCENNTVSGNTLNKNGKYGIFLVESDYNIVSGNSINKNRQYGLVLDESDNNTVSGNSINKNGEYGLLLYESDHNTVSGNSINKNSQYGLVLYRANYNYIEGNEFINNHQGCIAKYYGCTGNVIINNKCRHDFTNLFFSPPGILMLVGLISLPIASVGFWFWYKRSISTENKRKS